MQVPAKNSSSDDSDRESKESQLKRSRKDDRYKSLSPRILSIEAMAILLQVTFSLCLMQG